MPMVDPNIAAFDLHQSDLEAEAVGEIPTAVDCDRSSPLNISTEGLGIRLSRETMEIAPWSSLL